MGRIFVGLCQVGAWGCFDEFNRLEERMLSAVSQQIQTIQEALKEHQLQQAAIASAGSEGKASKAGESIVIELVGKQVTVNPHMAIFITMNPGYAGRSNLPDNLKKLFRSLAMTQPDNVLIAQVMLYSQGTFWCSSPPPVPIRYVSVDTSHRVPFCRKARAQSRAVLQAVQRAALIAVALRLRSALS